MWGHFVPVRYMGLENIPKTMPIVCFKYNLVGLSHDKYVSATPDSSSIDPPGVS